MVKSWNKYLIHHSGGCIGRFSDSVICFRHLFSVTWKRALSTKAPTFGYLSSEHQFCSQFCPHISSYQPSILTVMWTQFKRCSNNLFQEQIFHMYIYGCLCYSFLTFLRSSICSLLLSFDSSDTLGHGGGGSGDGVGLVEVFQNLKSIRSWERIRRSLKLMDMLLPWLTHQGVCQRAVVTSHWQGSKTEQRSWPAQCCRILLGWARPGIKMSMTMTRARISISKSKIKTISNSTSAILARSSGSLS